MAPDYRCGSTNARVSALGSTGTISKLAPVSCQCSTQACSSFRSAHSISWKQRAKDAGDVYGIRLYVEYENEHATRVYEKLGMAREHYHMYAEQI